MEIFDLMYDIEDLSNFEQDYDPHGVVPGSPIKNHKVKSTVMNLLAPEGLRGNAFRDTGEL
jgi:hypothetical protein